MSIKAKYILFNFLDFALTFGGTGAVVVYQCIAPDNTLGFKLTFGGIVLVIMTLLMAKAMFEKSYRQTYDTLLQQLAEATSAEDKAKIGKKLEEHKTKNNVYQRLMLLLPFGILYIVTYLGAVALESLNGTVGLVLLSMGGGSVFNVIKKPLGEQAKLQKLLK